MIVKRLGILAAMEAEISGFGVHKDDSVRVEVAGSCYQVSQVGNFEVVLVSCGIGKVAAAIATTVLLCRFEVDHVIQIGVAGGIGANVKIGDVVLASSLIQHDFDLRPLLLRHQIPSVNAKYISTDKNLTESLLKSATLFLNNDLISPMASIGDQKINNPPRIHRGVIATSDTFINSDSAAQSVLQATPEALCVEMEGASVAQVCIMFDVPFSVMRIISDRADACASQDFNKFLAQVAAVYSWGIMKRYLNVG